MRFATTTGDFDAYFQSTPEKVRQIHLAGFSSIDISFYDRNASNSWESEIPKLKDLEQELGVAYVQAHCPGGNPLCHDQNWQPLLDATITSIRCCGLLGIPNTVIHAGWADHLGKEAFFEENLKFFQLLFPAMEQYGVNLLIENSTRANMGERYYFYTGSDMKEFLEYANHPLLHACWDTGHANIEGHQHQDLVDLGKELYAIHFNDNRGTLDEHIHPFMGTMSVDEIMHGLLDANYQGAFTMECNSTLRPASYWLGNRHPYSRDERLFNPPLAIAQASEKLLFETGKAILQAYDLWDT